MTDIFECPVLQYKNRRRHFRVTDVSGRLLAETALLHGGAGPGRFAKIFSNTPDLSAFLLQTSRPDGEVLFFLERAEGEEAVFVLDADRHRIGRISAASPKIRGWHFAPRDQFIGVDEEPLGMIVWQMRRMRTSSHFRTISDARDINRHSEIFNNTNKPKWYCDLTTVNGQSFGHFERGILRLDHRFDRPLHTLIIAAPIIFHIKSPDEED